MSKLQKNNSVVQEVNGFKYVLNPDNKKYFIGDFIKLHDGGDTKYRLDDIHTMTIYVSCKIGGKLLRNITDIQDFYYKKDQKKYGIQKNPRIFEGDLESEIHDSYGNICKLKDVIISDGKILSKTLCTKIYKSNEVDNFDWILTSKCENNPNILKCAITNLYYYVFFMKNINKVDLNSLRLVNTYINLDAYHTSITTKYSTLHKIGINCQNSSKSIVIMNAKELLSMFPNDLCIGPRSGMLILKSEINRDGYKQYPSGYYFPEFKNIKKFKKGDNAHNYKYGLDSNTHLITEGLKYTFGVEIEMADCSFTNELLENFNIFVEKDGSIKNTRGDKYGPEIVTGVLKGDKGFEHLQALCNELARNGEVNITCGIHTHIGGADFNNSNIVMLFKLLKYIENDVFAMLPKSRRNNEYCKKLPDLDFNFDNCSSLMDLKIRINNYYTELFTKAANSPPNDKYNKNTNHPKGAKVGYDHNNIRYCWVNFIPALFNTRESNPPSYTIEFRAFNGSTNFIKIKNWIKICMAIVNFAENYHNDIMQGILTLNDGVTLPVTLKNVIQKVYPKSYRKLNEFIDMRTELFKESSGEDTIDEQKEETNKKIKELI